MKSKSVEIKKDSLRVLDEAHVQCEKKIEMGETRAEKLVNRLREECQMLQGDIISVHQEYRCLFCDEGENEIVMSKLQAVVESHSECLKKSQAVFEDQEETIHTILNDSVKKNEIFEDNSYKMKYAQESLEKQTNKKFQDLENKVRTYENGSGDFKRELEKVGKK